MRKKSLMLAAVLAEGVMMANHYEHMIWQRKKTSYNKRYRYH